MAKTDLIFPEFSSRFVDFAVQFCFRCKFSLGSLRNHNDDAEDNVDLKTNLYFTYESRDTLMSLTLLITVETIVKINPEHSDKFDIKN